MKKRTVKVPRKKFPLRLTREIHNFLLPIIEHWEWHDRKEKEYERRHGDSDWYALDLIEKCKHPVHEWEKQLPEWTMWYLDEYWKKQEKDENR